jgi:hypothetical protein
MSAASRQDLWQQLCDNGLAQGELPAQETGGSPWYVRVMLGFAGWLGALFLLGFMGLGFHSLFNSAPGALTAGVVFCAAAYGLYRIDIDNDFVDQFGLAIGMAGQAMVMIGLFNAFNTNAPTAFLLLFVFEAALSAVIPNFLHRVITTWAALLALSFGLQRLGVYGVAPALAAAGFAMVWLSEQRWTAAAPWRPIGYGLALALVQIDAALLWNVGMLFRLTGDAPAGLALYAPQIGAALTGAVFLACAWRLLEREKITLDQRSGMFLAGAAVAVALFSFAAHGLTSALLVVLLGYAAGSRVLTGLGLFALAGFLSHYYYLMQTTLLMKSGLLLLAGAVLLAARALSHLWFPPLPAPAAHEEKRDA